MSKGNKVLLMVAILSCFFLSFTLVGTWLAFEYLPSTISSTSELAGINGNALAKAHSDKLLEGALFPSVHHKKPLPPRQLTIRVNQEPNPYVKPLQSYYRASTAMAVKFRSLSKIPVTIWYDDGQEGVEQGHLTLGQETTTNTYEGHVFYFTNAANRNDEIARFRMSKDQVFYVIQDPNGQTPQELLDFTQRELQFMEDYFKRTGIHWRHYYGPNGPRAPPIHYMWPATVVGEVHGVTSSHGHWTCTGPAEECHSLDPIHMELEVVSLQPRAFIIPNFLTDFEASEIIRLGKPNIAVSQVGDGEAGRFESTTRTSFNTWIQRGQTPVIDTLYKRVADLIQIDESLLTREHCAEDMQVVHYINGQKYDSHHDWGVSGYPESRYITLLLYLTDMVSPDAGGETAFTKGGDNLQGFKVHPGKGSAVLFYDLLEDGNGDDLSLHAALPTVKGEKWLANFWVWDAKIRL